ncbi:MAG: proton-conducting transporter membrane subunit [bacterium]
MRGLLLLTIFTPFIGAIVIYLSSIILHDDKKINIISTLFCALTFIFSLSLYSPIVKGQLIETSLNNSSPTLNILPYLFKFRADPLGVFMAILASFLWLLTTIYSIEYLLHDKNKVRYQCFSLFSLFGMLGIVLSKNVLTLYIFFEILTILSYLLVIHNESSSDLRAGIKYLFMGIVGGIILLFSIILTYKATGSFDFVHGGLANLRNSPYFILIFWGYVIGFAVKAGVFPLHIWLPSAHPAAPSSASALLSGIIIKAGAFGLIKTIYSIFGRSQLNSWFTVKGLLVLSLISILFGSGMAIVQKELKKMLAYSSISHIGYIILGIALLSANGLQGGIFHILAHALSKGCLFLCAGILIHKLEIKKINEMKGLGLKMPVTMLCFSLAGLSMIGFPGFAGFVSKWYLGLGALESAGRGIISEGFGITIIAILMVSSLLTAAYYGPIIMDAWFGSQPHDPHDHDPLPEVAIEKCDPSWVMLLPIILLTIGVIVFGIFGTYTLAILGEKFPYLNSLV